MQVVSLFNSFNVVIKIRFVSELANGRIDCPDLFLKLFIKKDNGVIYSLYIKFRLMVRL